MTVTVKQATGDIWSLHAQGYYVVIPTNLYVTKDGKAVMGRGLALQAAQKWPQSPLWYGFHLLEHIRSTPMGRNPHMEDINRFDLLAVNHEWRLLFLPVKTSWQQQARKGLINASLDNLAILLDKPVLNGVQLAIPRLGCGNGGLSWEKDVKPIIRPFLSSLSDENRARLVFVHPPEEYLVG